MQLRQIIFIESTFFFKKIQKFYPNPPLPNTNPVAVTHATTDKEIWDCLQKINMAEEQEVFAI